MTHKHKFIKASPHIRNETHIEWREICQCGKSRLRQRRLPVRKLPKREQPKHRTPMKQVSDAKREWLRKYREQCQQDAPYQRCAMTGRLEHKDHLERHHVARRLGQHILIYIYLTAPAHRLVEENAKWAREKGWLRNIGQGYAIGTQPKPWLPGTCINEALLDKLEGR